MSPTRTYRFRHAIAVSIVWFGLCAAVCYGEDAATTAQTAMAKPADSRPMPDTAAWLRAGPMNGYAEIQETMLWLQTDAARQVVIRFWPRDDLEASRLSLPLTTVAENDFIAKVRLEGLRFGTEYRYELYLDGHLVALPDGAHFHTQPMWRWRQPPPDFTFAFGSCAYFNEATFDRPGRPYGSSSPIFDTAADLDLDFMVWLGDNVYYREADWLSEDGMRYRFAHDRATPILQRFLSSTHHYATWDDHDYGPNNSDRSYRLREAALEIFQDYWANPPMGTAETPGVFSRFEWGDAEFFLLDNRFHRSPSRWTGPGKQMLGPQQLRWLMEALVSSTADFKIIVGGSQFLNEMFYDIRWQEMWEMFPEEKNAFFDFLMRERIEGVVFLSGDRHHTELLKKERPGAYPLYDYTSSPLTAGTANPRRELENPLRVPDTFVKGRHNFGTITVAGPPENRRLVLKALASDGDVFWSHEIPHSELTFPKTEDSQP